MENYLKETHKYFEDEIMKLLLGVRTPNGSDYDEEILKKSLEELENHDCHLSPECGCDCVCPECGQTGNRHTSNCVRYL